MIKQIWFVRNITNLFVSLAFTINFIIGLYSTLSAFALTDTLNQEPFIKSMFQQFGHLLFFPFIGWCFFFFFFGLGIYLKKARKNFLKHKTIFFKGYLPDKSKLNLSQSEEMRLLFFSKFITCTNLSTSITFAFFSLDIVSKSKNIQSFGMFPVFLCWAVTFYYYATLIFKLCSSKQNLNNQLN